mmetsp:Transcript_41303/g.106883  ORF Transcript_41303/g.106883 Transcript_41303/m.106883 type:complete len:228 (-) Transcript_41303:330-1013(-)
MLLMQSMMPNSSSRATCDCSSGGETSIAFWTTRQPYMRFDSLSISPRSWFTTARRCSPLPVSSSSVTTWLPEASLLRRVTSGSSASHSALRSTGSAESSRACSSLLPCTSRASSPAWAMMSCMDSLLDPEPVRRTSRTTALQEESSALRGAASSRRPPRVLRSGCCLPPVCLLAVPVGEPGMLGAPPAAAWRSVGYMAGAISWLMPGIATAGIAPGAMPAPVGSICM